MGTRLAAEARLIFTTVVFTTIAIVIIRYELLSQAEPLQFNQTSFMALETAWPGKDAN